MADQMTADTKDSTSTQKRNRLLTDKDRENIGWFWKNYLREKMGWLILVLVLLIAQGFVYQQFLRLTENGLRLIFEEGTLADLLWVCLSVFLVIAFRGVMSYLTPRISAWISSDAIKKLRGHLIDHLMSLDQSYFDVTRPGTNIYRLTAQAESLGVFVGQSTTRAIRDLFTIIILSVYLFWRQPILFSAAAMVLPLIIIAMQLISRRIRSAQVQNQAAMAQYTNELEETISGMRTVKISGQEAVEADRLRSITETLKEKSIEVQSVNAMAMPFVDFAAAVVYALVIGGGGYMVLSPDYAVDGAAIIAFLIGLVLVFDPGRRLSTFFVSINSSLVVLDVVRSLFAHTPKIKNYPDAVGTFDAKADISFDGIEFGYNEDAPLFRDLSLKFEGGKTTAIVGPTGSGKTTLLGLISRLYDPKTGAISIGGTELKKIEIKALRSAFSVVAQDIVIFDNSIWENIKYVRPDASDDQIWAAAEAADIDQLIKDRGDQTVGPKGAQLSGGQRQRIAIARAFLRDADIILLDEATSALDQATEEKIKASLGELTKGKTTIIVAHRLSAISHADNILVMESGKLIESGSHAELEDSGGLYAQLYSAQREGYQNS